ncbi:MAG: TonB-dependent receptor plug domain-containing protein [Gammaproteobacteria bacterium]
MNALADIIIAALACLFLGTAVQAADPAPRSFDIPAQSLEGALIAFGTQSGIEVLFNSDTSKDLRSPDVSGTHNPDHALRLLLAETGLTAKVTSTGAVTIERPIIDPLRELVARAKEPLRLAEAETKPKAPVRKSEEGPTVLPEMTVTAKPTNDTSYNVYSATTATKTDTPIFDTPVSIQVAPQQVFRDQQVIAIKDALKNISGVQPNLSYGALYDNFIVRGFGTDSSTYRNGLRQTAFGFETTNLV